MRRPKKKKNGEFLDQLNEFQILKKSCYTKKVTRFIRLH